MKYISVKKLEKMSLDLAHAINNVRSWSTILAYNLNKKKEYDLEKLCNEAQTIADFGAQLHYHLRLRKTWVEKATSLQQVGLGYLKSQPLTPERKS
jgi:hypothetical protein